MTATTSNLYSTRCFYESPDKSYSTIPLFLYGVKVGVVGGHHFGISAIGERHNEAICQRHAAYCSFVSTYIKPKRVIKIFPHD